MKSIFNRLLLIGTGLALFAACKKDEARVNFLGGTPPVLTASVTDSVPLSFANAAKTAIVLSWTNPNYQFNTGVSSMDVPYLVEIDTAGANFTNPGKTALSCTGIRIGGAVFLDRQFIAKGTVDLNFANIGGDVTCENSQFEQTIKDPAAVASPHALSLDYAHLNGSVLLTNRFNSNG